MVLAAPVLAPEIHHQLHHHKEIMVVILAPLTVVVHILVAAVAALQRSVQTVLAVHQLGEMVALVQRLQYQGRL